MPRPLTLGLIGLTLIAAGCATSGSSGPTSSIGPIVVSTPSAPPETSGVSADVGHSPSPIAASASPGASVTLGPADFTTTIDNPWFPLVPGTTFTYHGTKDDKSAVDVYRVSDRTKVIDGVTCRVVDDRLYLDGVLEETTSDYYVQDKTGNVWYFGEDTAELDAKGKVVSREGTWHAGVDGAVPGIFMEADPTVGHTYAQEFYAGHAEDHFEVISTTASVAVPFGTFSDVVETKEWTPLEPDVLDHKDYVKGIGEVLEVTVQGPLEKLELVKVEGP